jgi:hypothetical protein
MKTKTFAADLASMMEAWNKIQAATRRRYPNASSDEIQRLTSGVMNHALSRPFTK